jgi:hypothetical protein
VPSWTQPSSPYQGAWLTRCQLRTPDNQVLIVPSAISLAAFVFADKSAEKGIGGRHASLLIDSPTVAALGEVEKTCSIVSLVRGRHGWITQPIQPVAKEASGPVTLCGATRKGYHTETIGGGNVRVETARDGVAA